MPNITDIEKIRPIIFISALVIFSILQVLFPSFENKMHKRRWGNWGIFLVSIATIRIFIPAGLAGVILLSQKYDFYLLAMHKLPFYLDLILTLLIFDVLIYWQHRFMHIFDSLWKLHRVHHCDKEMDVSTGFRFHPLEILFSAAYKIVFIIILSPRVETFIMYEILLNTMAMFNHSNFKISKKWDDRLRYFLVTPSMHYPHHDQNGRLMNLNYGNALSFWDRIFKTYTKEEVNIFGVKDVSTDESKSFIELIKLPFKK